jgi:hypothetical protein
MPSPNPDPWPAKLISHPKCHPLPIAIEISIVFALASRRMHCCSWIANYSDESIVILHAVTKGSQRIGKVNVLPSRKSWLKCDAIESWIWTGLTLKARRPKIRTISLGKIGWPLVDPQINCSESSEIQAEKRPSNICRNYYDLPDDLS